MALERLIDVIVPGLALPKYQRALQVKKYALAIFRNTCLLIKVDYIKHSSCFIRFLFYQA